MAAHLLATATTRKCYNPFFRQQQLKSLHDLIRERCPDIISAIVNDTLVSEAEATSECAITLSIIQEFYHATNPEQELKNEKCVARGENSDVRRRPWGVVYIEPDLGHTPFFAVIAPLCAALVAGNCVLLKVICGVSLDSANS